MNWSLQWSLFDNNNMLTSVFLRYYTFGFNTSNNNTSYLDFIPTHIIEK